PDQRLSILDGNPIRSKPLAPLRKLRERKGAAHGGPISRSVSFLCECDRAEGDSLMGGIKMANEMSASVGQDRANRGSDVLVSTGLLVLILTFSASNTQAGAAPITSSTAPLSATTAAEDHVVLERRFDSTRPCTPDL